MQRRPHLRKSLFRRFLKAGYVAILLVIAPHAHPADRVINWTVQTGIGRFGIITYTIKETNLVTKTVQTVYRSRQIYFGPLGTHSYVFRGRERRREMPPAQPPSWSRSLAYRRSGGCTIGASISVNNLRSQKPRILRLQGQSGQEFTIWSFGRHPRLNPVSCFQPRRVYRLYQVYQLIKIPANAPTKTCFLTCNLVDM